MGRTSPGGKAAVWQQPIHHAALRHRRPPLERRVRGRVFRGPVVHPRSLATIGKSVQGGNASSASRKPFSHQARKTTVARRLLLDGTQSSAILCILVLGGASMLVDLLIPTLKDSAEVQPLVEHACAMASRGGIGLAELLIQQLGGALDNKDGRDR